jgi:hypothetical protein
MAGDTRGSAELEGDGEGPARHTDAEALARASAHDSAGSC